LEGMGSYSLFSFLILEPKTFGIITHISYFSRKSSLFLANTNTWATIRGCFCANLLPRLI
jgi:hypothetical protein